MDFLTEFKEILAIEPKSPWDIITVKIDEKEWENIPFIIPKIMFVLEKRLTKM